MIIKWAATIDADTPKAKEWGDSVLIDDPKPSRILLAKAVDLLVIQYRELLERELLGVAIDDPPTVRMRKRCLPVPPASAAIERDVFGAERYDAALAGVE